jgi:hypothetical protein
MLTYSEHVGVQRQACATLRRLECDDSKSSKIAEAGGNEAVVAEMEVHKACVLVQQEGRSVLVVVQPCSQRRQQGQDSTGR